MTGTLKNPNPAEMLAHQTLHQWWSETSAGVETGETPEAAVAALEARYDITLPQDFRAYVRHGIPLSENWDDHDGHWWPFSRISSIPEAYSRPVNPPIAAKSAKHLFFLDFSMWSWAWAISCADDETHGKVAVVADNCGYVADSFTEFVERYVSEYGAMCTVSKERNFPGMSWVRQLLGR